MTLYMLAVFRPGTGAEWWKYGASTDEFKTLNAGYYNQGLRITDIHRDNNACVVVWRPGTGGQQVWYNLNEDEFKQKDTEYFNLGLRLTVLHREPDGEFTAVWRPGTGTQWVKWGLSALDFKTIDAEYFKQGLRIQAIDVYPFPPDDSKITAVWRPGSGGQHWEYLADWEAMNQSYLDKGYRLHSLSSYGGNTFVYRKGTGGQYAWRGLASDLEPVRADYYNKGYRMTILNPGHWF